MHSDKKTAATVTTWQPARASNGAGSRDKQECSGVGAYRCDTELPHSETRNGYSLPRVVINENWPKTLWTHRGVQLRQVPIVGFGPERGRRA